MNLIFWLNFSPVYRFGVHIFITISFIILLNFLNSKDFSKKIFIIFISIFLFFSFSKNIFRIINEEDIFIGIKKIDNQYILREDISSKYARIYRPDIENNKKTDGKEDFVGILHLFVLIINWKLRKKWIFSNY